MKNSPKKIHSKIYKRIAFYEKNVFLRLNQFCIIMDWGNTLQTKYNTWEENDALLLEKLTTFKTFRKGEIIIKEGTNDKYIYFLTKGFARGFYTDAWGNENTVFLPEEGFFFAAPECLLMDEKTTKYTFEALTDVEVSCIAFKELETAARTNAYAFDFYHTALKNVVMAFICRLEAFIEESPKERYQNLGKVRPNLPTRSLRKYLASFLGISPNSLSRIRKRLKND